MRQSSLKNRYKSPSLTIGWYHDLIKKEQIKELHSKSIQIIERRGVTIAGTLNLIKSHLIHSQATQFFAFFLHFIYSSLDICSAFVRRFNCKSVSINHFC